jgi:hypothetical protein
MRSTLYSDDVLSMAYISAVAKYANDISPRSTLHEEDILSAAYVSAIANYANSVPSTKLLKRRTAIRRRTLQRSKPSLGLTGAPALAEAYISEIGSNPYDTNHPTSTDSSDQASSVSLGSSILSADEIFQEPGPFSRSSTASTTSSNTEEVGDTRTFQDENVDYFEDSHSLPHQKVWFRRWPILRLRIPGSEGTENDQPGMKSLTNIYEGQVVKAALYRV